MVLVNGAMVVLAEGDEVAEPGAAAEPPGFDVVRNSGGAGAPDDGAPRPPLGAQSRAFLAAGAAAAAAGADRMAEGVQEYGGELAVATETLQGLRPQVDWLSGRVQGAGQRPGPAFDRLDASGDQQGDRGGLAAVRFDVGQVAQELAERVVPPLTGRGQPVTGGGIRVGRGEPSRLDGVPVVVGLGCRTGRACRIRRIKLGFLRGGSGLLGGRSRRSSSRASRVPVSGSKSPRRSQSPSSSGCRCRK